MPARKKPVLPDELVDQLMSGRDPSTVFDKDGLLDELKRAIAERALNAEMDHHLSAEAADGGGNSRNGYGKKTVLTDTGKVFAGCNVENAAYPEGWCAETTAIAHMVMDGGGRIAEVAVVASRQPRVTPCGGCRQRLAEFGTPDTLIHLCDMDGIVETLRLGDMLPNAFGTEKIG